MMFIVHGPGYTIEGGLADAQRLARQADVMHGATLAFLSRAGVSSGWACLDVGCGDGQVTIELARAVGLRGRVVGIDIDGEALALAREAAGRAGVEVQFLCVDAAELPQRDTFDRAYSRLMLSHLADPMSALRAMRSAVREGGIVAIEDLFTGTLRSNPPRAALDRLQEFYSATVRFHGGDPTIGPRLPAMLAAAELEDIREDTVSNRMSTVEQKLFLVELLDNMRAAIAEASAATECEFELARNGVDRAARDPGCVFHQARIHQVWGRRALRSEGGS